MDSQYPNGKFESLWVEHVNGRLDGVEETLKRHDAAIYGVRAEDGTVTDGLMRVVQDTKKEVTMGKKVAYWVLGLLVLDILTNIDHFVSAANTLKSMTGH